ncbi:MAG: tol-pal system protein YbgF [Neomegalonema sp.]|nr:tol-pal system protein YbgF [Neomegalonema sp.]
MFLNRCSTTDNSPLFERRAALSAGVAAAILIALFAGAAAWAQTSRGDPKWVNPDVIALRDEVELLRREVGRLKAGSAITGLPPGASPATAPIAGDPAKVEALEAEVKRLQSEIERISFESRRALRSRDTQIDELLARISVLEKKAGVTPPPSAAPAATPAPTPAPAAKPSMSAVAAAPGALGELTTPATPGAKSVTDAPIFEDGRKSATAVAPTKGATYESALEYLRARDLANAEKAFLGFIAANPKDPRVGEATYWLGETYYVRGQYPNAARSFLKSFKEHPTGAKAPDSLLRLGVTLAQLRQKAEACASFEQVSVRYPDAPASLLRRARVEAKRAGCK